MKLKLTPRLWARIIGKRFKDLKMQLRRKVSKRK